MTFTYDLSTESGQVRMLIGDTDQVNPIFQDEEIAVFLGLYQDDVMRSAAGALDAMAANQAYTLKVMRLLDISTDGRAVASSLHALAESLREEALAIDATNGGLFDWAEQVPNQFTLRERVIKQMQRRIIGLT